jgi:hypothetical protein
MEVYDEGNIQTDTKNVLSEWEKQYKYLYNFIPENGTFDDEFYNMTINGELRHEQMYTLAGCDSDITADEVRKVMRRAKANKAVGIDNLPNEILKHESSLEVLTVLFNKIYDTGLTPSDWKLAVIKPLPKNSMTDPRLPLQYRGISLLSTVYKLFTSIINDKMIVIAEENDLYADEQNGFRRRRSCEDHLYSLSAIIRNRKCKNKSTYAAFVDYEKAFDRVDRKLLLFKIRQFGYSGKIYNALKSVYTDSKACVNLNGYLTNSFSTDSGVRQGDALSPTLFGLYINDLVSVLHECGAGIKLTSDLEISCLLYADDLVLLAESEDNLQILLNKVSEWCQEWRMKVNIDKTKVVHFHPRRQSVTDSTFMFGTNQLEVVDRYKYLGLVFDENLDFSVTAEVLAKSAGRALGAIYAKFGKLKDLGYKTYTKLYNTGVAPILDYASAIWGYKSFSKIDTIQNRAIRFYLGVHTFAPNLAINGDMGWLGSDTRRKVNMIRFWNRLISMDDS